MPLQVEPFLWDVLSYAFGFGGSPNPNHRFLAEQADIDDTGHVTDEPYDGHGGECDRDVAMRAWPVFEEAVAGVDGGVLVLTAHYNVIRVLASVALGIPPERSFAFRLDKGRVTLLEDTDRGFRLIAHNLHDPGAFEHTDEYLGLNPAQSGPKH